MRVYRSEKIQLLSFLGILGGFITLVYVFGHLLTFMVTSKLFKAAIIRQAYRVQKYDRDFTRYDNQDESQLQSNNTSKQQLQLQSLED